MAGKDKYGKPGQFESSVLKFYSFLPYGRVKAWLAAYFRTEDAIRAESKSSSLSSAVKDFAVAGFLVGLASGFAGFLSMTVFGGRIGGMMGGLAGMMGGGILGFGGEIAMLAATVVITTVFYPVAWLAGSGFYYLFARLFGGKGGFAAQTSVLAMVLGGAMLLVLPLQLLSVIPFIGWLFALASVVPSLYALYGYFRVFRGVHKLSDGRAILVLVLPGLVLAFLVAVVVLLAVFYLTPAYSGTRMMY